MAKYLWRESHSGLWQVDAEWADRLLPLRAADSPQEFPLVAALRQAESVKGGRGRRTLRITIGGRRLYVKQYDAQWRGRRLVRREWLSARWAFEQGLPVARPVAACWKAGRPTLVTEDAGAETLGQLIQRYYYPPTADEPPYPGDRPTELMALYRQRAERLAPQTLSPAQIARLLADLLLQLDQKGLRHRDLHPGNLVLGRAGEGPSSPLRLVLLDLLELEVMPGPASLEDHLVQLDHYFEPLASRSERFRLLAMLTESLRPMKRRARALEQAAWRYHRRQWRGRDQRPLRESKYFRRLNSASVSGMVVTDLAEALEAAGELSAEGLWQELTIGEPVKDSRRSQSGFGQLLGRRVFIKGGSAGGSRKSSVPWPGIVDVWLRGTRQRRAWVKGHGLLARGIRTARPLLWLDRRHGPRGRQSVLVCEALEDDWRRLDLALAATSGREHLALVEAVARMVRRLHDSGMSHRDLKAQNLLVRSMASRWQAALVDMDGVAAHTGAAPHGRRVQNLMRLAFSWSGVGISGQATGLTRSDRLRFLKTYLGPHVRQTITIRRQAAVRQDAATKNLELVRHWWEEIDAALTAKSRRARR